MHKPVITIITITFNAEKFLERTLLSAQNAIARIADPTQIEYLIVDGKSQDDTLAIARRYQHLITHIISEKDKGLYDAMNKGMRLATGNYLWFLNAGDEIYDPQVLAGLLPLLQTGTDVFYSDAMLVRDDGSEIGLRSQITPHALPHKLSWKDFDMGMKVCHQAFIAKKEIAPDYDITNLSADIDWEISCLKHADTIQYVPFVLCKYLTGGISVKNHRRSLFDRFRVLRKHFGLSTTLLNHSRILMRGIGTIFLKGKYW